MIAPECRIPDIYKELPSNTGLLVYEQLLHETRAPPWSLDAREVLTAQGHKYAPVQKVPHILQTSTGSCWVWSRLHECDQGDELFAVNPLRQKLNHRASQWSRPGDARYSHALQTSSLRWYHEAVISVPVCIVLDRGNRSAPFRDLRVSPCVGTSATRSVCRAYICQNTHENCRLASYITT